MTYDAVIIGGGPAGATAGYYLAKSGMKALIIEKSNFPRYCVGESLLPYNMEIFKEMNFDTVLEEAGFNRKYGAIFGESDGDNITRIDFSKGMESGYDYAYQVPRDQFDELLLDHAINNGVEKRKGLVKEPLMEGDRVIGVSVELEDGSIQQIHSKVLIDASGRLFFLGKRFDMMEPDPYVDTVSVFSLFKGINTLESHHEAKKGDIIILAYNDGWFWFIPFADGRTSVGTVVYSKFYEKHKNKSNDEFFNEMVESASGRIKKLLSGAERLERHHKLKSFSTHVKQVAGPGWVTVGDSAMFVDPVYSAGVLVAMTGGKVVAGLTSKAIKANHSINETTYEPFKKALKAGYDVVLPFIYRFRNPLFQKILFNPPKDGGETAKMITTVLAGCFFDFPLIEKEHNSFWNYMDQRGINPYIPD